EAEGREPHHEQDQDRPQEKAPVRSLARESESERHLDRFRRIHASPSVRYRACCSPAQHRRTPTNEAHAPHPKRGGGDTAMKPFSRRAAVCREAQPAVRAGRLATTALLGPDATSPLARESLAMRPRGDHRFPREGG